MKGHLQSRALDASVYPSVTALGELYRTPARAAWKYRHDGAQACCIESLVAAHDCGALAGDTIAGVACRRCSRIWRRVAGWWVIPQPEARRPLKSLRHGRAASERRDRAAPKTMREAWIQKREDARR